MVGFHRAYFSFPFPRAGFLLLFSHRFVANHVVAPIVFITMPASLPTQEGFVLYVVFSPLIGLQQAGCCATFHESCVSCPPDFAFNPGKFFPSARSFPSAVASESHSYSCSSLIFGPFDSAAKRKKLHALASSPPRQERAPSRT